MNELRVSLVQTQLHWENSRKNKVLLENHVSKIEETDLIILPEMFTTAFTMNAMKNAERMDGESVNWMRVMAQQKDAVVCGSLIIEENNNYYNRMIWMSPSGEIQTYDKRHLFSMANEDESFTQGNEKLIAEIKGWKVCPLICYDLRFPIWSRNKLTKDNKADYDLLIYVANWPSPRAAAWEKLLYARAIENQCYTLGVNRIGKDEKGLEYIGGSMLIDMKGELIWKATEKQEEVFTYSIDLSMLNDFREKFPVGRDADSFVVK